MPPSLFRALVDRWLTTRPEFKRPLGVPTGPYHRDGYRFVGGDAEKAQAEREVKAIEAELAAAAARLDRLRGEAQ